ncbi:TIGR04086 family membrane protein [Terribacillus sp. DMT04]|uniref:TIGR04086 family membrane protein n=1 Tax=Terribacillus sp. DMT04 TaxID=2850441 RepID=UPI001C2BCD44|nr:TIGR04086 family membrane protein [Terribacillus sp. DMT04]QXE00532.1 TIGR04086 family membrane protein [Terribacillus sp. DMT04]
MKKNVQAILYGWITVFSLLLFISFTLALLLRFTKMGEGMLDWTTLGAGILSLFIGGFIAGVKGEDKGWMLGGMTAMGFTVFVLLYQYLGYQVGFSGAQLLTHGGFLLASLIGGMIGVNIKTSAT